MGPANFWARLVDGVAISRASSTIFATLGTALVSLLVIPVLEIVYSLLFGADLHSTQLLRTAYVATCVSFTSAICSGWLAAWRRTVSWGGHRASSMKFLGLL